MRFWEIIDFVDKIFYKKLVQGSATGRLDYVRNSESADVFTVIHVPDVDKWSICFKLTGKAKTEICQVWSKRGEIRTFRFEGAYKFIRENTTESAFTVVFDPSLSLRQVVEIRYT